MLRSAFAGELSLITNAREHGCPRAPRLIIAGFVLSAMTGIGRKAWVVRFLV